MGNPKRGCGTKKENAFYLEGNPRNPPGKSGNVWAWAWCLGDGIENLAPTSFPPRQVVFINPAACIATGTMVMADDDYHAAPWEYDLYARMCRATKTIGAGDHVGSTHYSAMGFAKETNEYGPSRRISRNVATAYAKIIAQAGAIPVFFSHARVPVFSNINQRKNAYDMAVDVFPLAARDDVYFAATWQDENWGMYDSPRRRQNPGNRSFMKPILSVVAAIEDDWHLHQQDARWKEVKEFYGSLAYQEQLFGSSWITQVTYTIPADGRFDSDLKNIPGLRFLDLEKEEYVR